jgi:tRNA modification GTPase
LNYLSDTITAISTAVGGGIAIVRLSGERALDIAQSLFIPAGKCAYKSHHLYYGHIQFDGKVIDEVILSIMKGPKSYTREDVVEISCHGGLKSVEMIMKAVLDKGVRLAEPGEFTKRAFLNGRISLNEAQAVIDIINAKTDISHNQALGRLKGAVSDEIFNLRDRLLNICAGLEMTIDYPEYDSEIDYMDTLGEHIKTIKAAIEALIKGADTGLIFTEGIQAVILGRPNVGKSSLLNRILNRDRAIVTDIPGTTRDILQETASIKGIPVRLVDTAGLRGTDDIVEKAGVDLSLEYARDSDVILFMVDGSYPVTDEDISTAEIIKNRKAIVIINKADKPLAFDTGRIKAVLFNAPVVYASAKNGEGMDDIYETLYNMFVSNEISVENTTLISSLRDKRSLELALFHLNEAENAVNAGMTEDIIVIDLMESYRYLGEITGETLGDDVINRIFERFCLGK